MENKFKNSIEELINSSYYLDKNELISLVTSYTRGEYRAFKGNCPLKTTKVRFAFDPLPDLTAFFIHKQYIPQNGFCNVVLKWENDQTFNKYELRLIGSTLHLLIKCVSHFEQNTNNESLTFLLKTYEQVGIEKISIENINWDHILDLCLKYCYTDSFNADSAFLKEEILKNILEIKKTRNLIFLTSIYQLLRINLNYLDHEYFSLSLIYLPIKK